MSALLLTLGCLALAGWYATNVIRLLMPWVSRKHAWFAVIHLFGVIGAARWAWIFGAR